LRVYGGIFLGPLGKVLVFLYRFIVLGSYKLLIRGAKTVDQVISPVKTTYLIPFLNRFVTHGIIIALACIIAFLNYQVQETRAESFGEQSILYALVKGSDLAVEQLEVESSDRPNTLGTSYLSDELLGTNVALEGVPSDTSPSGDTDGNISITQGGAVQPTEVASLEPSRQIRDKVREYTVVAGDTISGIAENFDLNTTTILWANNLTASSYVKPGQLLTIPPVDGVIYTVAKGDSVKKIATRYESVEQDIINFNKLADASDISIGQQLILPGGHPYYAPAPIQRPKIGSINSILSKPTAGAIKSGGFIWPTTTRRISQYFSWRHTGLDIDGNFGDTIWAAGDGVVSRVQYLNWGYGYNVIISHGGGTDTLYAHFQKIYVQPGQQVTKGQALGEMGSTGRSTGSHLHFEYRLNGSRLNPFAYVSQ